MSSHLIPLWKPAANRVGVSEEQLRHLLGRRGTDVYRLENAGPEKVPDPWGYPHEFRDKLQSIWNIQAAHGNFRAMRRGAYNIDFLPHRCGLYVFSDDLDSVKNEFQELQSRIGEWLSLSEAQKITDLRTIGIDAAVKHGLLTIYAVPESAPKFAPYPQAAAAKGYATKLLPSDADLMWWRQKEISGLRYHTAGVVFRRHEVELFAGLKSPTPELPPSKRDEQRQRKKKALDRVKQIDPHNEMTWQEIWQDHRVTADLNRAFSSYANFVKQGGKTLPRSNRLGGRPKIQET